MQTSIRLTGLRKSHAPRDNWTVKGLGALVITLLFSDTTDADDVLFNVRGTTDKSINSVNFGGLLLAFQFNVGISSATWFSEVMAGKNFAFTLASITNPVPLPASVLLLGSGLVGLGLLGRRRKHC